MLRGLVASALVLGLSWLSACGGGDAGVDEPCEDDASCQDGLVCDDHGGEKTCQEPHGHGTSSNSSSNAAGSTSSASSGAGGAGGEGGSADPCSAYCACMEPTCGGFGAYPFDTQAACMTACQGFTEAERACFAAFCTQASEAVAGVEHLCEHAWGELGTSEC